MSKKEQGEMSFLDHVEELRWHLVRAFIAIFSFAIVAFFSKKILFDQIILAPKDPDFITYRIFCNISRWLGLDEALCMSEIPFKLQNIDMAGQFTTHIWVSLIAGFILAFPYVIWEVWRFISPGLNPKERRYSSGIIFFTSILFSTGVAFGYFVIAPLSVNFLGTYTISEQVFNEINLGSYISTVTTVTLATGIVFELPILVYFLTKIGLLTPQFMRKYRRHALVLTLILSAIITPPDVSSQVLVSIPILILYELSIGISAWVIKRKNEQ